MKIYETYTFHIFLYYLHKVQKNTKRLLSMRTPDYNPCRIADTPYNTHGFAIYWSDLNGSSMFFVWSDAGRLITCR